MIAHLVRRGRQVRRDADRRQRARADGRREAADRCCRATRYTYCPNTQSVPNFAAPEGAQPPAQHHRRRRDPRAGAPRACCSARAPRRAATRSSSRTASSATSTTTSAASSSTSNPRTSSRPASTSSASSSSRRGEPDMQQGKGAPGRLQLYVDGTLVGNADAAVTTPFMFNPGALTCGANPGSPVTPDYEGPFALHRHAPQRHPGRQRRADPGPRSGATTPTWPGSRAGETTRSSPRPGSSAPTGVDDGVSDQPDSAVGAPAVGA